MNVRNTWKEGIDMDTILGLLAIAVIGGYLLAKKEPGKIRLLPTPADNEKRGLRYLVALFIIGGVGSTLHQPPAPSATQKAQQADEAAQKSANPEKSSDHHKLAVQQISDGTGVDEARAESILTILHKVSIRDHDFDSVHRYENGKALLLYDNSF